MSHPYWTTPEGQQVLLEEEARLAREATLAPPPGSPPVVSDPTGGGPAREAVRTAQHTATNLKDTK